MICLNWLQKWWEDNYHIMDALVDGVYKSDWTWHEVLETVLSNPEEDVLISMFLRAEGDYKAGDLLYGGFHLVLRDEAGAGGDVQSDVGKVCRALFNDKCRGKMEISVYRDQVDSSFDIEIPASDLRVTPDAQLPLIYRKMAESFARVLSLNTVDFAVYQPNQLVRTVIAPGFKGKPLLTDEEILALQGECSSRSPIPRSKSETVFNRHYLRQMYWIAERGVNGRRREHA